MGITHFDDAESAVAELGHLRSRWTYLGYSAGMTAVGVSRIQVQDGYWATPAHEHDAEEEIFYVLAGTGISWQDGSTAAIRAGDCIVYLPGEGAHTLHGLDGLDVLAFGTNLLVEVIQFPRQGLTRVGTRVVETIEGVSNDVPTQWVRESDLGPPELEGDPGPRPSTIVNVADVEPVRMRRARVVRERRKVSGAAGSVRAGLQHVVVEAGKEASAQHCHTMEEELFVVLEGDGTLLLGDEELPVRAGSVVGRPAATGIAHTFRAGDHGLTYLAWGTREPGDICYYPRSNKIAFRGVNLIARLKNLDYWDGED